MSASLCELQLHELSRICTYLCRESIIPRCAFEIRSNNIPRNPPLTQMIHRRESPRKSIRLIISRTRCNPKGQILRYRCHDWDSIQGIVHGKYSSGGSDWSVVVRAFVDVVGTLDVC